MGLLYSVIKCPALILNRRDPELALRPASDSREQMTYFERVLSRTDDTAPYVFSRSAFSFAQSGWRRTNHGLI